MISQEQKYTIQTELENRITQEGSARKVALKMKGVSEGTLSQIRNNNWDLIADSMWSKVASQIKSGVVSTNEWLFAHTSTTDDFYNRFNQAKNNVLSMGIVASAGSGKSATAKAYAKENDHVFVLSCNEYWDKRWFLKELLTTMGLNPAGLTLPEMMERTVKHLQSISYHKPMIIFDEADKLKNKVLLFFITLYNRLEDDCAFILMATQFLEKRINHGVSRNYAGYEEILSRIGRKVIHIQPVTNYDTILICSTNGIDDDKIIKKIWKESESDVRRIKRLVIGHKINQTAYA